MKCQEIYGGPCTPALIVKLYSQKVLGRWDKDRGRQIVTRVAHDLISYRKLSLIRSFYCGCISIGYMHFQFNLTL